MKVAVVTQNKFDPTWSNAYMTTRMGYLNGFRLLGMDAEFVPYREINNYIDDTLFWLTAYDYPLLSVEQLDIIKANPHMVQVNTWFKGMEKIHKSFNVPDPTLPKGALSKLHYTNPNFVWATTPESHLGYYEGWTLEGFKVVSLPQACDTVRYHLEDGTHFTDTQMAFVGGYRSYKEPQYADYLWPYEDKLQTWGYSEWPRCYQGYLPNDEESLLYQGAVLCPTISEPQFSITGDTVERPFKILGSGGLTVFDCMPAYRSMFDSNTVLIPSTVSEYHDMVAFVLNGGDGPAYYRDAGYWEVVNKHTYKHRCRKVLNQL